MHRRLAGVATPSCHCHDLMIADQRILGRGSLTTIRHLEKLIAINAAISEELVDEEVKRRVKTEFSLRSSVTDSDFVTKPSAVRDCNLQIFIPDERSASELP